MPELKLAPELELAGVLAVASAACALPGVFLVLRRMALVSDAIGHTLLFGIVVAFFVVGDLDSPFLLLGAALTGLATVVLVESLQCNRRMKADAAIGLVFPFLFALAVTLVSLGARNIHLDVDAVLVGQPLGAPPAIAIFAEAIGLATARSGLVNFGDDLDALDAVVPEPSSVSLLAGLAGFAAVVLWRRRWR